MAGSARLALAWAASRALAAVAAAMVVLSCAGTLAQEPARPAPAPAACPASEFAPFLEAFAESAALQKSFTRMPLTKRHLDKMAEPEPATVEQRLSAGEVRFPVFPGREARARQHFSMKVESRAPDLVDVVLWEEDTDHQIAFTFERTDCWRLVVVDDQSL